MKRINVDLAHWDGVWVNDAFCEKDDDVLTLFPVDEDVPTIDVDLLSLSKSEKERLMLLLDELILEARWQVKYLKKLREIAARKVKKS